MNDDTQLSKLIAWVRQVLGEGLVLSEDVAGFMTSAFGTDDINAVLDQVHDSEIDSLLELLCYPGMEIQTRFESRWGYCAFTAGDLEKLLNLLGAGPRRIPILAPTGTRLALIDIPPFALEAFVQRLKITWQPPPELALALERHPSNECRLAARVHLRNARLQWHPQQIRLMVLYLGKMPADRDPFETGLTFLISILSEMPPDCDSYDFLAAKKFFYFQSLCRAEDFERKRQSSNMEIMILQGARAAHGSIDEWRCNMRQIDIICQALFGRTEFFQQPGEHCLETADADPTRQIQDVMRLLS